MKKLKKCMLSFFFILLLFLCGKVYGAIVTLSPSNSNVTVGDEFNVSVRYSGEGVGSLTTRMNIDTSKVQYVSGPANSNFSNGRAIYTWTNYSSPITNATVVTFRLKAISTGSASFSVGGEFYTPNLATVKPSFSGTNITIKEKTTSTPPSNNGSQSTPSSPSTRRF